MNVYLLTVVLLVALFLEVTLYQIGIKLLLAAKRLHMVSQYLLDALDDP